MLNPPVQAQWSLSGTAGSAVTMTMGVLSALTSDSVQPIAYLVCERFGATLAISRDTLLNVETLLVPTPPPAPVAFLQAQVGFFSNDCATQLSNSQAGVRFLALAAALASTLPLFGAACAVEMMLRSSTSDLTLLPTDRHIKGLLESLEARCHRVGFANDVLEWRILLQEVVLPLFECDVRNTRQRGYVAQELLETAPSPEMIARLVDAYREVARIGPSTVTRVTIHLCSAVPWVMSFTKWCLGAPPRLAFDGVSSEDILSSPSPVTLLIPRRVVDISHDAGLRFTIHHGIGRPTELLAPSGNELWTGMVPMKSYGVLLLHELGCGRDTQHAMIHEALGCAIPQCFKLLNFSQFVPRGESAWHLRTSRSIDRRLCRYLFSPFHGIQKIAATCAGLVDLPRTPDLEAAATTGLVGHCPLVKAYLEDVIAECPCSRCSGDASRAPWNDPVFDPCDCEKFYSGLGSIVATVLSLSLFDIPAGSQSPPLLSVPSSKVIDNGMLDRIKDVLKRGCIANADISDLIGHLRRMVGHDGTEPEKDLIMTSGKGQVVYPALFETLNIRGQGYMSLSCVPVREPANLFPNLQAYWEITKGDDGHLGCILGVQSQTDPSSSIQTWAMGPLFGLQRGLLLATCEHSAWDTLKEPDGSSRYCNTLHVDNYESLPDWHVDVVAVHGAEGLLRLATVGYNYTLRPTGLFYVIRGNACLSCCLQLCRMAGIHCLIL